MARTPKNKRLVITDVPWIALAMGIYILSRRKSKPADSEQLHSPAYQRKLLRVSIIYRLAGIIYNE